MTTDLDRWTIQIADRARTAQRDFTETLVEIGDLLGKVRAALPHGAWLKWLEQMPFAQRSAANYLALSAWATRRPGDFLRLKGLGPSKLYAILRLPATRLRRLRPGRSFLVPGTDRERTLERMSVPEVHALVATLLQPEDTSRALANIVAGYRQRLSRLLRATVVLLSRRAELPRDVVTQLRAALAEITAQFGARPWLTRAGP